MLLADDGREEGAERDAISPPASMRSYLDAMCALGAMCALSGGIVGLNVW